MELMLDLDGVLVDFIKGMEQFHGFPMVHEGWFFNYEAMDISEEDFWNPIGKDFYANLDWTEDGALILEMCEYVVGKDNICILTSTIRNPDAAAGKLQWIQDQIPEYRRRYLIGPPKHFCSNRHRILVDDADHNIEAWNGPSILVPRPWNKNSNLPTLPLVETQLKMIKEHHFERNLP